MVFEIRKYILEKLCFPQVLSIDKPGMILHKKIALFGGRDVVTRSIFVFEDIYVKLFFNTVEKIGEEKAADLWYRIGKEVTLRYLELYRGFVRNKSNVKKMIDYFSNHFSGSGVSVFNNYRFDLSKGVFSFWGSNSVIYRKTLNGSYIAGAVSGMISFLLDKNVEAKWSLGNSREECKVVANFSFPSKCIVDENILSENYVKPIMKSQHSIFSNLSSFSDFLKFGIVSIDDSRKFCFKEKTLIPVEIGLPTIFYLNYKRIGLEDVYEKSVVDSSKEICEEILSNQKTIDNKILAIRNVASAFGWGEPFLSKQGRVVKVNFLNPFFYKRTPSIIQYFFNGFLNYIYEKDFLIDFVGESGFQYSLKES